MEDIKCNDTREVFRQLDNIRRENGISTKQIAQDLGMTTHNYYRSLSGFESQPTVPKVSTCMEFAKQMNCELCFQLKRNDKA